MMLYSILDITSTSVRQLLAVLCDNQPFIAKAPMALVFVADCQRWFDAYACAGLSPRVPGPGDLALAFADTMAAAQNTVVAAQALGVGSCYIGDILENCEQVRALLGLPIYTVPAAMLVFGIPRTPQKPLKKPQRFEPEYLVFENTYRRLSAREHEQMQRRRMEASTQRGLPAGRTVEDYFYRKYHSDFMEEMNRSMHVYLEAFGEGKQPADASGEKPGL